jgi:transposase InsO family protein
LAYGALAVRGDALPGVIMRADQRSDYTVRLFRVACERLPIRQSMGRPGSPYKRDDRVLAFHRGTGAAVRVTFATSALARTVIAAWIEDCNTRRGTRPAARDAQSPTSW